MKTSKISTNEVKILVPGHQPMVNLLGERDELLKIIEKEFNSTIMVRGNEITIYGDEAELEIIGDLFEELLTLLSSGMALNVESVEKAIEMMREEGELNPTEVFTDIIISRRGKIIRPKTPNQKRYIEAIRKKTIVFSIGPAGTGKTYLAMAMAVKALTTKQVGRIILTRPAVEAGEKLGFLPGDLYQKVDPYLRPLYDCLYEMLDLEKFTKYMDQGVIEVAPLAFMRGRTLNDSFIVLDEAQNTSPEQMKMFLTRLGFGSKAVVTGDITQIDLPGGQKSGMNVVREILTDIESIDFLYLDEKDVVRHKIVQEIVRAYKRYDDTRNNEPA
ncbi:MAG: phosphate starvation-inducible protein PhoH [Candidatus Solincola sediminis]|uniref:PhoH-like protein n=1 Tax=Candidatus Solincola sediminis TaxID=1797199 RepID=A0A1F2WGP8_9ACTN|nr:MAG: phosphate starvation-inducible protein PhoH [Candidatus Solincola sediminis]